MTTNWTIDSGGQPPGPHPNQRSKRRRFALVTTLLVIIAGLVAGAGLFMESRADVASPAAASYLALETEVPEPVFEPRDAEGADPFFPLPVQLAAFREEQEAAGSQDFDVDALDEAVKTGLYGGTAENTCDPERLISFLYANPILGEAWAHVQGIEFADIADYIRSLEVRVLAEDLPVNNHGFSFENGAAYQIDSILEAGTAVLVDDKGDVRARCYCGNPITPKMPVPMPPRCVVWVEHVYASAGGGDKRRAPRDVLLTGQRTLVEGAEWVEIKWGDAADERGWVRADNLRSHYCPPEKADPLCPGPDAVPVWEGPDETSQVGYHAGTLNLVDGPTPIFGPVEPVGGMNPVVVDDFLLVHFRQAAPSVQDSAWVRLSDLNQDPEECHRIPACVDTQGDVLLRAGDPAGSPGGIMRVEFTGRFVTDVITSVEVRLLEDLGQPAWINSAYIALPDEECDEITEYACVTDHGGAGTFVYETSDQELPDHLGHLYNAIVQVTGPAEDGRLPILMADGGPAGWVDEADFTAALAECVPTYQCYATLGPAWTVYPDQGDMIAAFGASIIGKVGKLVDPTDDVPASYERIVVDGVEYWIDQDDLIPLPEFDCVDIDCPEIQVPPVVAAYSGRVECCAAGEVHSGPSAAEATGEEFGPAVVLVLDVEGDWYQVAVDGEVFWIHVSSFLPPQEFGCEPLCPNESIVSLIFVIGPDGGIRVSCCASVTIAGEQVFEVVTLTGETMEIEGVLHFGTVEHGYVPVTDFVGKGRCEMPDVECPGDSLVGIAIVDNFEDGIATFIYSCCASVTNAAGQQLFEVVTLTGETMVIDGVLHYGTVDHGYIPESDFANAGRCEPPTFECPNGSAVPTPSACPTPTPPARPTPTPTTPPGFVCPDGTVVATPSSCPTPTPTPTPIPTPTTPPGFVCPDGSVVPTPSACPTPTPTPTPTTPPCPRDRVIPGGGCCPEGSRPFRLDPNSRYQCIRPEG